MCQKRFSFEWIKPRRKRVSSFNPPGSKMMKMLFSNWRIKGNSSCFNALIEVTWINFEPFFKGGREKWRFKMLSSTIVTWSIDIHSQNFPYSFSDILMTVWVQWYAKYEGVYFLGLTNIFKGFDNFSKTEGVRWLVVYSRLLASNFTNCLASSQVFFTGFTILQ